MVSCIFVDEGPEAMDYVLGVHVRRAVCVGKVVSVHALEGVVAERGEDVGVCVETEVVGHISQSGMREYFGGVEGAHLVIPCQGAKMLDITKL